MHLLIPTLILVSAMIMDLRTKKVFNAFVLGAAAAAVLNSCYFFGWEGLTAGLVAAGLAALMSVPLFVARVLGGGDVKLLIAFGLATTYQTVFSVIIGSFIWAALIGLFYAVLRGSFKILALNTLAILKGEKPETIQFHKLPYTVALVMAWLTHFTLQRTGGLLW